MIDIWQYHWFWYLLGFICCPKITFMILLSLHVKGIPLPLMVIGWIFAILGSTSIVEDKK